MKSALSYGRSRFYYGRDLFITPATGFSWPTHFHQSRMNAPKLSSFSFLSWVKVWLIRFLVFEIFFFTENYLGCDSEKIVKMLQNQKFCLNFVQNFSIADLSGKKIVLHKKSPFYLKYFWRCQFRAQTHFFAAMLCLNCTLDFHLN